MPASQLSCRIERIFETLAEAVDALENELDVPLHGAALVELLAIKDRLVARVAMAVGAYEHTGTWEVEGATSMTAWMRDRGGQSRRDTFQLRRSAGRFRELPEVAAAACEGRLSGGQVDVVLGALADDTVPVFAAQEAELVHHLEALGMTDTIAVLSHWQAHARADGVPPSQDPVRSLHHSATLGGRWEGTWSLDAEAGAIVDTAIRLATTRDVGGEPLRTAAHRRADALVDVCRHFLDHQHTRPGGRHRPHLNVIVDTDDRGHVAAGRIVDGPPLDRPTLERLTCDCAFHRLALGGGSALLDYGRATRTIPAPLWNALVARDQHCRFPGCDRPVHWCEAHHVVAWDHVGETRPDNLALLCSRHHHRLHMPGWHAKLLPDATLEVTLPDGTVRGTSPPGTLVLDMRPPSRRPPP